MIKQSGVRLDFVFIASCHSEFAVDIFSRAGARHVIGIKADSTINDVAILTFTQSFYTRIWEMGSKVCLCYRKALVDVTLKHGPD